MKRRSKNRQFRKIKGSGDFPVDQYPMIDKYIPDAELIADDQAREAKYIDEDGRPLRNTKEWPLWFLAAMDNILIKQGLRVG